jgi:stage II sporulation protein D
VNGQLRSYRGFVRPKRWISAIATAATTASVALVALVASVAMAPPAAAAETYYRPADGVLHLAGHGFGHGHGMSQWGAYGGAEYGKTWRQIVAWYYASPAFATKSATISVQISAAGSGPTTVVPATGLTVLDGAKHSLVLPTSIGGKAVDLWRALLASDGTLRVQGHTSAGWSNVAPTGGTVTSWSGTWLRFTSRARIVTLVRPSGTRVNYRDSIQFDKVSSTGGMTVNLVTLEHYLYGVVPSEMPCSWTPTVSGTKRLDGLESQAVAARSYASWRIDNPRSSYATIIDNTFDQAYGGYTAEQTAASNCPWTTSSGTKTSASDEAVNATAGTIMVDSTGHAIFAQYSASNGGFELSGGHSYLPSRPDAWDGRPTESWNSHNWTDTVTASQIQAAYPTIGSFESMTITSREHLSGTDQNGHTVSEQWGGRVTGMTLTGSRGSVNITGASFRSALGLMSEWFVVVVTRPSAPQNVTASPGDAQATLHWAAPASDGGGGIINYTITASPSIPTVTVSASSRSAVITGLTNDTTYVFSVVAHNSSGPGPAGTSPAVTPSARLLFHPVTHVVTYDSGSPGIAPGGTKSVPVTGVGGVPSTGVKAVALDIVSLTSTTAGSFSVWPHGRTKPPTPQLYWAAGQRVNTTVYVDVGTNGLVDVFNAAGTTRLIVMIEGYYEADTTAGDALTAVKAYRLFGGRTGTTIAAQATQSFPVVGRDGVPTGASAAVLQLTVVNTPGRAYLRAWPSGSAKSGVYDLYGPGGSRTVTTIVPLDSSGSVSLSPYSTVAVTADLLGWFAPVSASPATGSTTLLIAAKRLRNTRVTAGGTTTLSVPTTVGVPTSAHSVLVTLTAYGPTHGYVIAWPAGTTRPGTGNLELRGGTPVGSTVLVPLGTGAKISVYNGSSSTLRLVVDVVGWSSG